jgi:23S rRNA (pseudouridine1915-N3)-methyltransferase
MRITVLTIGRLREPHLQALYDDYAKRLARASFGRPRLKELELRNSLEGPERLGREAALLCDHLPDGACLVALDARGKDLGSEGLARFIAAQQVQGRKDLVFAIGGSEGFDPKIRKIAHLVLSMGKMTWPHLFVRIMLMEQLYRADCIHRNHPYHRD